MGRILTSLRQRGVLKEPVRFRVKRRRGVQHRPWALRKPNEYAVQRPGDRVQLDTLDLRPGPGVVLKQFTARDTISRWDVIEVHGRATSTAAHLFLDTLQRRLPFPLPAVQVDGGGEFAAVFEQTRQQRGVKLHVLPPRSPKLNGQVERPNSTHTEGFYEVTPFSLSLSPNSTADSRNGNELTTPSVLTRPSVTSPHNSSSLNPQPNRKDPECQQSTGRVQGVD